MLRPRLVYLVTSPTTAWTLLRGQLEAFERRGFETTLIAAPGELLERVARREGVRAIGVPMDRAPSPSGDRTALKSLTEILRDIRPHLINASTPKAGLLGVIAGARTGIPVRVYTLRGLRADGFSGPTALVLRIFERIACARAHRVLCVSESLRHRAAELRLARSDKLRVLGAGSSNGVDNVRFCRRPALLDEAEALRARIGLPRGVPVVGFVGRLVRDKGGEELLAAFEQLSQRVPQLHLLLVGAQEDYNGLSRCCRSVFANHPRVAATGWLDEPAAGYALADVIALPTYREGFPNVALEAAAMELPIVATRVTGCVDAVVDGVTGTLVPPRDSCGLARAIEGYLVSPEFRQRHGRAGRERVVREFRPERIWDALCKEYVELLAARGLPLPHDGFENVQTQRARTGGCE